MALGQSVTQKNLKAIAIAIGENNMVELTVGMIWVIYFENNLSILNQVCETIFKAFVWKNHSNYWKLRLWSVVRKLFLF